MAKPLEGECSTLQCSSPGAALSAVFKTYMACGCGAQRQAAACRCALASSAMPPRTPAASCRTGLLFSTNQCLMDRWRAAPRGAEPAAAFSLNQNLNS